MASKVKGRHSKAIHGGLEPEKHHGAVSVPIYQTSTFAFPTAEEGAARLRVPLSVDVASGPSWATAKG